tara:strand:- start:393 stop:974 length:582 start_codon:yes stop_codon:yes gene_type:complete
MPQPLKKFKALVVGPHTLQQRPDLAFHIGQIATGWAHVELNLGLLLANITQANPQVTVAMYLNLSSQTARNAALEAAAETQFDETDLSKFKALMKEVRAVAKQRNDVVHALWGVEETRKDALIRIDPSEQIRGLSNTMGKSAPLSNVATASFEPVRRWAWIDSDFTQVETRMDKLVFQLFEFRGKVHKKYPAR